MKRIYLLLLLVLASNISRAQTYYINGGNQPGGTPSATGIACPGSTVQYSFINNSGTPTAYKWRITKGNSGGQTIICNSPTINVTWDADLAANGKLEVFKVNLCSDAITGTPLATLTIRKYNYPAGIGSGSTDVCTATPAQLACNGPQNITYTFWLSDSNTDYSQDLWTAVNSSSTISLPTNWTVNSITTYSKAKCLSDIDYERVVLSVHTDGVHAGDVKFRVKGTCDGGYNSSYGEWTTIHTAFAQIDLSQSNSAKIFCNSTSSNTVSVSSSIATSFNWVVPNGYLINGISTNLTTTSNSVTITSPSATANGTLTVTGLSSCGASSPVNIPLYYGPQVPGNINFIPNAPPGRFTLSVDPVIGATSYNWYVNTVFKGNTTLPRIILPNSGNLSCGGDYYFACESVGACGTSQQSYIYVFDPLGCGNGSVAFSVYPNPASEFLNVAYNENTNQAGPQQTQLNQGLGARQGFAIMLYDNKGKLLKSLPKLDIEPKKIQTTDIPNGIYYLHIKYADKLIRQQIIIKH